MNQTIETLLSHRSVRHFEDKPLSNEQIEMIVMSAQGASTSSNIQAYSIIGITDPEKKKKLAELAGNQSYVKKMDISLYFVQIYTVMKSLGKLKIVDVMTSIESTEKFMVTTY